MPAVRVGPALVAMWRLHRTLYRVSGGRLGARFGGFGVLLLTTTGRKSGRPARVTLSYLEDDGQPVVVGSYAGEDRHPAWYLNLQAHPVAEVMRGGETARVRARTTIGEERQRLLARFVAIDPAYGEYQRRTSRQLPVVVLEPADDAA